MSRNTSKQNTSNAYLTLTFMYSALPSKKIPSDILHLQWDFDARLTRSCLSQLFKLDELEVIFDVNTSCLYGNRNCGSNEVTTTNSYRPCHAERETKKKETKTDNRLASCRGRKHERSGTCQCTCGKLLKAQGGSELWKYGGLISFLSLFALRKPGLSSLCF